MHLGQLRYLLAVAKYKSFSKAADTLFISPQALGRSISSLEKELQVKLFERYATGVQLTKDGKRIVEMSKNIIAEYDRAIKEVHGNTFYRERKDVLLYTHSVYADSYLNDVVIKFNSKQDNIKVKICEYVLFNERYKNINKEYDANWIIFAAIPEEEEMYSKFTDYLLKDGDLDLIYTPKLDGEYVACVSKENLLAKQETVSLKILSQQPIVRFDLGNEEYDQIGKIFQGYKLNTVYTANNLMAWTNAIMEDIGIGLIQDVVCRSHAKTRDLFNKVRILKIRERIKLMAVLYLPKNYSKEVKVFADFIVDELKKI